MKLCFKRPILVAYDPITLDELQRFPIGGGGRIVSPMVWENGCVYMEFIIGVGIMEMEEEARKGLFYLIASTIMV